MSQAVDLNGIKTAIAALLTSQNVQGATVRDLSLGMTQRVNGIHKVNPQMIKTQMSLYPMVTCYITQKDWIREDIAGSQVNAKRQSRIYIEVAGAVWNANFQTITEDPADEDINKLMENIEYILRSDTTLGGKVLWQRPSSLQFYVVPMDQQTHLRAGILQLQATVFY